MTIQEAVLIVQTMERARQGRLRAKFMRDIRQQEERERLAQQRGTQSKYAYRIQSFLSLDLIPDFMASLQRELTTLFFFLAVLAGILRPICNQSPSPTICYSLLK